MHMEVRIKNYGNRIDAEVDKALLESHEIKCFIMSDDAGGMRPDLMMSSGGVWILVDKNDAEAALKLLEKK